MLTQTSTTPSTWFNDAHTILSVVGVLMMGALSLIGYKVHDVLFKLKLPERMARFEATKEDHENRIHNLEKKTFGL